MEGCPFKIGTSHQLSMHKSVVLAQVVLLFGCETWVCPPAMMQPFEPFHMRWSRTICHISLWQRKTNMDILSICQMKSVDTLVTLRHLRWLSHTAIMGADLRLKRLLFGHIPRFLQYLKQRPRSLARALISFGKNVCEKILPS